MTAVPYKLQWRCYIDSYDHTIRQFDAWRWWLQAQTFHLKLRTNRCRYRHGYCWQSIGTCHRPIQRFSHNTCVTDDRQTDRQHIVPKRRPNGWPKYANYINLWWLAWRNGQNVRLVIKSSWIRRPGDSLSTGFITWIEWRTGKPSQHIANTKVNSAFHPSGIGKLSTGLPTWG